MGAKTSIEWTNATWNPLRGCSRKNDECINCYAERDGGRWCGPGQPYDGLIRITTTGPQWTGEVAFIESHLYDPLRWTKPRMVFVNSVSDLFHESVTDETIARIYAVMAFARHHTFQILTKRWERMQRTLSDPDFREQVDEWVSLMLHDDPDPPPALRWNPDRRRTDDARATAPDVLGDDWPLPHVWQGISAGRQKSLDAAVPYLLQTPAAVRWVSAEPLLESLTFRKHPPFIAHLGAAPVECPHGFDACLTCDRGVDWVVVGGESGPGARMLHVDWVRSVVKQCHEAHVPVFVKQLGAIPVVDAGRLRHWEWRTDDSRVTFSPYPCLTSDLWRVHLKDRKGGDITEWPQDLRVREHLLVTEGV